MDLITPSFGLIFWHTIIFLLLIFFLSKFAFKPIINFIDKRENYIKKSVNNALKLKQELNKINIIKSTILEKAYKEQKIIIKEAKNLKEEIKIKTEKECLLKQKKMVNTAKKNIHIEQKKALIELKNEIQEISINISEKILGEKLYKKDIQEKFIKSLIDKNIQ